MSVLYILCIFVMAAAARLCAPRLDFGVSREGLFLAGSTGGAGSLPAGEDDEDDSDVKIAGSPPAGKIDEAQSEASELEAQRRCGNLQKAHALGAALSDLLLREAGSGTGELDRQRRLLLAFTAQSSMEVWVKSRVLSGVALNSFYDALKASGFYDDINNSGAFSFYLLCARRDGDLAACIGRTFAMLCGSGDDEDIKALGRTLYLRFSEAAEKTIKSFDFKQ